MFFGVCIFVFKGLSKKIRYKNKNPEKVFYPLPREVIRFALRQNRGPKYLLNLVLSLYKCCKTVVSIEGELSYSFFKLFSRKMVFMKDQVLSPLLFAILMHALIEDVRDCSLIDLLYADGVVLCRAFLDEVVGKLER